MTRFAIKCAVIALVIMLFLRLERAERLERRARRHIVRLTHLVQQGGR
jgi:hypothetical protein